MNTNEVLIEHMQGAIDKEQQPANREKPLTLGLLKAIDIIKEHAAKEAAIRYEYTSDGLSWADVVCQQNIQYFIQLGFWVRRKKV